LSFEISRNFFTTFLFAQNVTLYQLDSYYNSVEITKKILDFYDYFNYINRKNLKIVMTLEN